MARTRWACLRQVSCQQLQAVSKAGQYCCGAMLQENTQLAPLPASPSTLLAWWGSAVCLAGAEQGSGPEPGDSAVAQSG